MIRGGKTLAPNWPWLWIIASSVTLCGCGEDRPRAYPANGRVVFSDGTPVKLGTVELLSEEHGTTATGRIQPDGTFVLGTWESTDGACAGDHKAIVSQMMIFDGMVRHTTDHGSPVDTKYGSYTTSPLRVTIRKSASNKLELQVEKAPREKGGSSGSGTK